MKLYNKILSFSFIMLSMLTLTGCDEVQIFETQTDPFALVALKDSQLADDVYYVKNGTRFFQIYMPGYGNASNGTAVLNESRVFLTMKDDSLIPTYYQDELIALQSESTALEEINLERYCEVGYSIGCFSGTVTPDGFLMFDPTQTLVGGSALGSAIGNTEAKEARIASIDGKTLSSEQINTKAGVITGLEQGKTYKVGYYVGTKYYEKNIVADCKVYEAYEMFYYGSDYISDTPNGYMGISMPEELKSGFYNINGSGLFKYYDYTKGTYDDAETDMNESYYTDEKSKIEAYSRQYSVSVPKRVKDFKVTVELESVETQYADDAISGIVFAPDGTQMQMDFDSEEKELSIALAEGMAGDWTVNVIPKTLQVKEVKVDNDKIAEETTCEETTFTLPEGRENVEFYAEYTSYKTNVADCTVFGTILDESGKTYEMQLGVDETDRDNPIYYLTYEVPYAAEGTYVVRIYHYPEETSIGEPVVRDKTVTDTEIIVVDG